MASVSRVIPLLVCEDIAATHDFLVAAFGFEPGGVERDGSGRVVHGEVRSGDAVIWLHAVSPDHELASPRALPQTSGGLVVQVADVDAHFAHAREAGATIDSEPVDQEYGQREYGARDTEGHRWWFATPIDKR
jgi:MerR family transcriptional regulator, thiopeptide resistance regulator